MSVVAAALTLMVIWGSTEGQSRQEAQATRLRSSYAGTMEKANQCRFQYLDKARWTPREEFRTAQCVVERFPIEGGLPKLMAVGYCESGFDRLEHANPPFVGIFQHIRSSWSGRRALYSPEWWTLRPSWKNSRTMIVVTVLMQREQGWSPWSCA